MFHPNLHRASEPLNGTSGFIRGQSLELHTSDQSASAISDLVQLTKDQDVAIITINNPLVNALGPGVPECKRSASR